MDEGSHGYASFILLESKIQDDEFENVGLSFVSSSNVDL